jgi:hypothetical protein
VSNTLTWGHLSVFDTYLHYPRVSVKKLYTCRQCKCKCKKFGHVNVNDLHLHEIYMSYKWLLTLTCTTLVVTNEKLSNQLLRFLVDGIKSIDYALLLNGDWVLKQIAQDFGAIMLQCYKIWEHCSVF